MLDDSPEHSPPPKKKKEKKRKQQKNKLFKSMAFFSGVGERPSCKGRRFSEGGALKIMEDQRRAPKDTHTKKYNSLSLSPSLSLSLSLCLEVTSR